MSDDHASQDSSDSPTASGAESAMYDDSLSPTVTDPDKYKTIFENDQVRVMEYYDRPGAQTAMHEYRGNYIVYPLTDFLRRLYYPDGTYHDMEIKRGMIHAGQGKGLRAGENTGVTDTHSIIFELQETPLRAASAGDPIRQASARLTHK